MDLRPPSREGLARGATRSASRAAPSSTLPRPSSASRGSTAAGNVGAASRFGFSGAGGALPPGGAGRVTRSGGLSSKRDAESAGLEDAAGPSRKPAAARTSVLRSSVSASNNPLSASTGPSSSIPPSPAKILESEIVKTELERQRLLHNQSYEKLEALFVEKDLEVQKLQREKVEIFRNWEDQVEEHKGKESAWKETKARLEQEVSTSRKSGTAASNDLALLQTRHDSLAQQSRTEVSQLKQRLIAAEGENAEAKELWKLERAEKERLTQEWQKEKEALVRGKQAEATNRGEDRGLADELHKQVSHVRQLESTNLHLENENKRFRSNQASIEVLREEKRALEGRLARLQDTDKRLAEAEVRVMQLEDEKENWSKELKEGSVEAYTKAYMLASDATPSSSLPTIDAPPSLTPSNFSDFIATLRGSCEGFKQRLVHVLSKFEAAQITSLEAQKEAESLRGDFERLREEKAALSLAKLRAEKMEQSAQEEVKRHKAIFDTYEMEAANHSATYDRGNAELVSELEAAVQRLQTECSELSAELEAARAQGLAASSRAVPEDSKERELAQAQLQQVRQELEQGQAAFSQLEKECERLGKENDDIWRRYMGGEHAKTLRVLEMPANPAAQKMDLSRKRIEALQSENEKLLGRVAQLERLEGNSAQQGDAASVTAAETMTIVKELKSSIEAKDKALLRLRQTFSAKAREYRQVFEALFGYKCKWEMDGRVKLTSSFARSKHGTTLIFRSEANNVGEMKVTGEALRGMADVDSLRRYWLEGQYNSVPCFLAALNISLFENTTRAQLGGWAPDPAEAQEEEES
ncbi:Mitotic checkpoint protein MAD1 [Ceraceosorus bombacis]|uniref:Spindle assembly checkpoint component MAD1 n=1 Tax=Ceraceosorus bombacis TaxID=401625 RepID=A0A0P1BLC6_9BASI|nr:Mitotic checkpoint protein MAD1 [Ceraceosorus bombacis]